MTIEYKGTIYGVPFHSNMDMPWAIPDADISEDTPAETAHAFHAGGYDCLMRTGHCVAPIPRLDMALALAYWDDV